MMTGLICASATGNGPVSARDDHFEVKISQTGRTILVRVRGPLDLHYTPGFVQQVNRFISARKHVVVDLRHADYVDSSGIRALLRIQKDLEANQGELRLVISPGSRVERVIKLLQLHSHFRLFPTVADACNNLAPARAA